jgi:transcriptional regulator GlxA family with amidase domain
VVVAFDGVQLLDVSGPVEVLAAANNHGADYAVNTVSPAGADVMTSAGMRVGAEAPAPGAIDTLIVPGRGRWREAVADRALMDLVRDLAGRSRRVTSVCAGAFLLAEAGLLNGRKATTHWQLARDLARAYPDVDVEHAKPA